MLASIMDHNASHTGSTCCVEALVSTTRTIANIMMMNPNEKMAAKADFCWRLICRFQRSRSGRAMMSRSQTISTAVE